MRIVLQPLYIIAFWCTYRIGSLLFSRRVGVWAAILVGLSFDYAFCSVEFRTDNLCAPLWLLCMAVLLNGALTMRCALISGFLMGLCFGVSMKTSLLLMSILIGGSLTALAKNAANLPNVSVVILSRSALPVLSVIVALVTLPLAVSTVISQMPVPVAWARLASYG